MEMKAEGAERSCVEDHKQSAASSSSFSEGSSIVTWKSPGVYRQATSSPSSR